MKSSSLQDLFLIELSDLYDAEHQLIKACQNWPRHPRRKALRGAFEEHLEKTKEHAARIERIFAAPRYRRPSARSARACRGSFPRATTC